MSNKIWIVPIEPVDTRYTGQWYDYLPVQMRNYGLNVQVIDGEEVPPIPTPGAFLDFGATNVYKSSQLIHIANLFRSGAVKAGDYFLYTDAWNPTIIQLKYMSELLNIPVKIGGLQHAGSYDPQDFLGRLIGDKQWVRHAEQSMFHCFDHLFFATRFHVNMFAKELMGVEALFEEDAAEALMDSYPSVRIVGWPMEYLREMLAPLASTPKNQKIIFPHRLAPEKQLEIFRDLEQSMPQYDWFVAQDRSLTKGEYHQHLAESKLMFSANLQETLGISAYEAALVGCLPILPSRLSYPEMWDHDGFYPSEWTQDWESYQKNKPKLLSLIHFLMEDTNEDISRWAVHAAERTGDQFFNGKKLYEAIANSMQS